MVSNETQGNIPTSELAHLEEIAEKYLLEEKKWKIDEFRLEYKGISEDGKLVNIWAVYLEDEKNPMRGGGKSLSLYVDRNTKRVAQELHFQ
ncbi:hypothetical protein ACFL0L_03710 [Patescibacteria group bacterium]